MLTIMRTIVVKKGFTELVVERFSKQAPFQKIEGFIDASVLVKKSKRSDETEEVVVQIRWESEEAWKRWETSEEHIAGHRAKRGKASPEYVVSSSHAMYEVRTIKLPVQADEAVIS